MQHLDGHTARDWVAPCRAKCSLEPVPLHRCHKCLGNLYTGPIADDAIDSTVRTKSGLSDFGGIFINPLGDQGWLKQ